MSYAKKQMSFADSLRSDKESHQPEKRGDIMSDEQKLKRKKIEKLKCFRCVWSKDAGTKLVCMFGRCFYAK